MIKDDGTYIWLDVLIEKTRTVTVKAKDENGNPVKQRVEKFAGYDTLLTRFNKHSISLISQCVSGKRKLKTRTSFYDKTTDGFYTIKCSVEDLHRHTKTKPIIGFKVGK